MVYTLLLYSLDPYRWNDGMTDRGTNTLASRGLEEPAHASLGLEEAFFQLCCCVLVVHTAMYLEYHTVVVLRLFFLFWREIVFGVTYVLSVQYSCAVVSFLLLWRESYLVYNVQLCCCVSFLVIVGNSSY